MSTTITLKIKPFDFGALEKEFQKAIEEGMNELAEEVEWEWRIKAAQQLNTSREEYLKGLSFTKQKDSLEVTIEGWVANMIELGHESFDMKPGLLKGNLWRVIPMGKPPGSGIGGRLGPGFATVSKNSPDGSWVWKEHKHKGGIQLNKVIQKEVDEKLVPKIFKKLLEDIKFKK